MRWTGLGLLALTIALASCGMDGGSSGTGITSAEGNVAAVTRTAAAASAGGVAGIEVVVDGTDARGTTGADGRFVVRGRFDGVATLLFRRASDGLHARMAIDVPRGGTLTLPNVRIDAAAEEATAERPWAVFDARVAATDCDARTLTLGSLGAAAAADDSQYVVHLDGALLHDAGGAALGCGDLRPGVRVHVQALVNGDLSFGGADVEVAR